MKSSTFLLLIASLFLTGCMGKWMSNAIQDDGEQIPPLLGSTPDTLLAILYGSKGYDRALAERMAENYNGPYKLVTQTELGEQYTDTILYRYVFDRETRINNSGNTSCTFHVMDRQIQKKYHAHFATGLYGTLMKVYLRKLEIKRKANAAQ